MTNVITINKQKIGNGYSPYVIAEAGVNHNGSLALALKMVDAAADAKADAIKFQTFKAEQVTTAQTKLAGYQQKNTGRKQSLIAMIKKLELKDSDYPKIIERCWRRGITFLSAPHGGFESVDLLQRLNVPAFKFGSADLTNLPVLRYAAKFKKPMIISTGMATIPEIKQAIAVIKKAGNNKIIVLHCTTDYPTDVTDVNLSVIPRFAQELKTLIGYSDHTLGIEVPLMAATLGACLIEKHFTLDRNLRGPDQAASMTPAELGMMAEQLKQVPLVLGNSIKKPTEREKKYIPLVRKSVVANTNINAGHKITAADLGIKRPGTGLAPKYFDTIVGRIAKRAIKKDTLIKQSDLK